MHPVRPSWTNQRRVGKKKVEHDRNVKPAFRGPDIGEVGEPLLVQLVSLQVAIQNVVGNQRPFAVVLRLPAASWPCAQGLDPHQPFDPVKVAGQPLFQHIVPEAASPVGPVAGLEARLDCRGKLDVMDLAGAGRTIEPRMEAGSRNAKSIAQPADGPGEVRLVS